MQSSEEYKKVFNEAEQLRHAAKIPEALRAYSDLLRFRLEWEEREPGLVFTINEFFIVDRLADLALLTRNRSAAKYLLSALIDITRSVGNSGMRIYVVTKLLLINLQDGNFEEAIENAGSISDVIGDINKIDISPQGLIIWENSIRLDPESSEQDEADQLVCLYDALGALLLSLGRFAEAILMFQRGIQIGELNRSPVVDSRFLPMKLLRIKAFFQKGEVESAEKLMAEDEKVTKGAELSSGLYMRCLELKSAIALAKGNMREVYELLNELILLCRQLHLPLAEIHANFNLAMVKIVLNQVSDATYILQDCLVKAERSDETGLANRIKRFLQVAESRMQPTIPPLNYLNSRQQVKKTPLSKSMAEPANYRHSGDYLGFFNERALLFQIHLAENDHEKAGEILSQLKVLVPKCDSALIHYRFKVLSFMQLYFTNTVIPPDFPVSTIINYFATNQLLPELWQFRHLLRHTNLVPENERSDWIKKNHELLDYITNSLPPEMQTLFLLNKWSVNEEYLAGYSSRLLQEKQQMQDLKFTLFRWFKSWKMAKGLYVFQEETKRYKDHLSRKIAAGADPDVFTFLTGKAGMLAKLWRQPKRSLSVSFLVLPDRIVIISRSFLKIRLYVTFINRTTLRQMVFALRDSFYPEGRYREISIGKTMREPHANVNELLLHLEKILQLETILAEHKKHMEHISFIPDDILHGFPFSLLTLNETKLLSKIRISVSIDDMTQKQEKIPFFEKNILLAGFSKQTDELAALPGVHAEIKKIDQQLKNEGANVNVLLDEDATILKIKNYLPTADVVHFSCHGKFDFQQPAKSGLVLAEGEMMTLTDILAMQNLARIRLVVLSSCRGAEHYILPGRWIIGLPETFCRAGVQAVLAFLWPVNDDFASVFTSRFYEHLKNNGAAESFRLTISDAQNKQLSGLNFDYWHPKYWGGAIFYER